MLTNVSQRLEQIQATIGSRLRNKQQTRCSDGAAKHAPQHTHKLNIAVESTDPVVGPIGDEKVIVYVFLCFFMSFHVVHVFLLCIDLCGCFLSCIGHVSSCLFMSFQI